MTGAPDGFSPAERARLLGLKGVGPTVIARLEQLGYRTLAQLAEADADDIVRRIAAHVGSTCWRNSPQARTAIETALAAARCNAG